VHRGALHCTVLGLGKFRTWNIFGGMYDFCHVFVSRFSSDCNRQYCAFTVTRIRTYILLQTGAQVVFAHLQFSRVLWMKMRIVYESRSRSSLPQPLFILLLTWSSFHAITFVNASSLNDFEVNLIWGVLNHWFLSRRRFGMCFKTAGKSFTWKYWKET
jgi:hypothetical protein